MLFSLVVRMRARLCLLLFLVATFAVPVTVAGAASSGGSSKTKIQQDLDQVSKQQQAALAQLKQAQAQKAAVDAKAAQLDAQVSAAQAQLDPLAAEAARLGAQYFTVAVQLQAKEAELEAARKRLDRSAVQMYRDARRGSSYDILSVSQPEQLVIGNEYLDHVSSRRTRVVQRVTELRDELDAQKKTVADQKAKADAAVAAAQAERDRLASLRSQVEPARGAGRRGRVRRVEGRLRARSAEAATGIAARGAAGAVRQHLGDTPRAAAVPSARAARASSARSPEGSPVPSGTGSTPSSVGGSCTPVTTSPRARARPSTPAGRARS